MASGASAKLELLFQAKLREWVTAALEENSQSLAAIVEMLPGTDPLMAREMIRTLAAEGDSQACLVLQAEARSSGTDVETRPMRRPITHALDFAWRFTDETVATFCRLLGDLTADGDAIAYLGAPSVYAVAQDELPGRHQYLFDVRDPEIEGQTNEKRVHQLDLLADQLPDLKVDAALADPPWYPQHLQAFTWAAQEMLRENSRLLISHPPTGVRPGITEELRDFRQWLVRGGMVVVDHQPLMLRYETPPFEDRAFRAAGLLNVPSAWRRGDLLIVERGKETNLARPPIRRERSWQRIEVSEIPLFVAHSDVRSAAIESPLIESVVPGDLLPSVSRRHPLRSSLALWSSANRVYGSPAPDLLVIVVEALANKGDPSAAVAAYLGRALETDEQELVAAAAKTIRGLVQTEREEFGLNG